MNRNYPNVNDSAKWKPRPFTDKPDFLEKPNYTTRSGKMVEVLYGRNHCSFIKQKITLVCTYFSATKRHNRRPNGNKSFVQNKNTNDYLYSNTHKLYTTATIEDDKSNYDYSVELDNNSKSINSVLEDLGFMSKFDHNYTVYPSEIKCFNANKQFNIGYYDSNNISSNPEKLTSNSNRFQFNQKGKYKKQIPYETFPDKYYYNKNWNYNQKSITQKNANFNPSIYTKEPNYYRQKYIPQKYWAMRYTLFSNFDRGIVLDEESFYSVCPEILSYHIAKRCKNNIVVDPFCGAGGNVIQLAKTSKKVIAIDIDPEKIRLARHNAEICGVSDKIEFMVGDFFKIYPMIKADVLFMSPPWGGPGYANEKVFSLESMCEDHFGGGLDIFDLATTIAPNIAFHMPKNTNILECLWLAKDFRKVEIQQNVINGKLNSLTAFYGDFNWSN